LRKTKDRFAKLGTIFLAVIVALALTGMGYGIWSATLNITGTIETGVVGFDLTATDNYTVDPGGSVTCEVDGDALKVTVINADDDYDYYGAYSIENTGDIPLKMLVDESTVPTDVGAEIINVVGDGTIDPLETEEGEVHVYLTASTTPPQGETFTVITNAVMWNQ